MAALGRQADNLDSRRGAARPDIAGRDERCQPHQSGPAAAQRGVTADWAAGDERDAAGDDVTPPSDDVTVTSCDGPDRPTKTAPTVSAGTRPAAVTCRRPGQRIRSLCQGGTVGRAAGRRPTLIDPETPPHHSRGVT